MKKQTLMAFTLAATALMGTSAFAADGTITFTGEIKDATCDISTSSGSSAVTIPSLAKANLSSVDMTGPDKLFDIKLSGSGCTGATNQVQVKFENTAATIDPVSGLLVNTDPTTGDSVGVELVDSTGAAIPLNDPAYRTPAVAITTNAATIPLKVRYKAKATPVVAGPVVASVGLIVETF